MPQVATLLDVNNITHDESGNQVTFQVPVLNKEWRDLLQPSAEEFFNQPGNYFIYGNLLKREDYLVEDFTTQAFELHGYLYELAQPQERDDYINGMRKKIALYQEVDSLLGTSICSEITNNQLHPQEQSLTAEHKQTIKESIVKKYGNFSSFENALRERMRAQYPLTTTTLPTQGDYAFHLEKIGHTTLTKSFDPDKLTFTFFGNENFTTEHIAQIAQSVNLVANRINDNAKSSADISPLIQNARTVKSDKLPSLPLDGTKASSEIIDILSQTDSISLANTPKIEPVLIPHFKLTAFNDADIADFPNLDRALEEANTKLSKPFIGFDVGPTPHLIQSRLDEIASKTIKPLLATLFKTTAYNEEKKVYYNPSDLRANLTLKASTNVIHSADDALYKDDQGNYFFKCSIDMASGEEHSSLWEFSPILNKKDLRGTCLGTACVLKEILQTHCNLEENSVRITLLDIKTHETRAGMDTTLTTTSATTELLIGPLTQEMVSSIGTKLAHDFSVNTLIQKLSKNLHTAISMESTSKGA